MRNRTTFIATAITLLTASAHATEVRTVQDLRTSPVDIRALAPLQKLIELPQAPVLNLGLTAIPQLNALPALQPVETVPNLPVAQAPITNTAHEPIAAKAQTKGVQASLSSFAERISKDEIISGGAQAHSLSGAFFDNFLTLPEEQTIPKAEAAQDIAREIEQPPELLRAKGIQGTVVVYGSARIPSPEQAQALYKTTIEKYGRKPKSPEGRAALKTARQALKNSSYYQLARRFGELVAKGGKGKVAVVTGGGPGIMEAANRGAFEAGGPSVGFNIKLEHEQFPNPYLTPGLSFDFEHFTSRKMNLRHGAVAMVYFPGGFGTMDELFEVLTLMQTGKIARRPIVLVGEKSYWDQILDFKKFAQMGMISKEDLKLFRFAETAEDAWAIVRAQRSGN